MKGGDEKMDGTLMLGIGVLMIIAACSFVLFASQGETGEIISNTISTKGDTETVHTEKGDKFSIRLDSNPTTGYRWELEFDSSYIQLVNRTYTPSEMGLLGAGGAETFEFLALKRGETEIKFYYLRPWEKKPPVMTKVFKIKIE